VEATEELERKLFGQPLAGLTAKLRSSRRLKRCWQLIESHYEDPNLGLERAAKIAGISKNHLNVRLRLACDLTFHQLVIRYRLLRAIGAMARTNLTVLEIALANGFGSLSSFERQFRAIIGETPQSSRERLSRG
jgi:AraC family transcriptional regulator